MNELLLKTVISPDVWRDNLSTFLNLYNLITEFDEKEIDADTLFQIYNHMYFKSCLYYMFIDIDFKTLIYKHLNKLKKDSKNRVLNIEEIDNIRFSLLDIFQTFNLFERGYLTSYFEGLDMKFPITADYKHISECYQDLIPTLNSFIKFYYPDNLNMNTRGHFISLRNFLKLLSRDNIEKYIREIASSNIVLKNIKDDYPSIKKLPKDVYILNYFENRKVIVFFLKNTTKEKYMYFLNYHRCDFRLVLSKHIIACGIFDSLEYFIKTMNIKRFFKEG